MGKIITENLAYAKARALSTACGVCLGGWEWLGLVGWLVGRSGLVGVLGKGVLDECSFFFFLWIGFCLGFVIFLGLVSGCGLAFGWSSSLPINGYPDVSR